MTVRVAVVAEFYPRAHDPVLGVWAHRQAIAARDAGAEVEVLVLDRPIPPMSTPRRRLAPETRRLLAQPRRVELDGIPIRYVRFASPPRPRSYGSWGRWAAPSLGVALRRLRRQFPYDLVHAHNAVPAADAVRRSGEKRPLVVSVHGGDVYYTALQSSTGEQNVRAAFGAARIVLANSTGIAAQARALGAGDTRVVHLGADLAAHPPALTLERPAGEQVTIVTVGHLVARKRHADVLRAMWSLRDRAPDLRYLVIGDGPERGALTALADTLGLTDRVEFAGQLDHPRALERVRDEGAILAMPSVDEALGVAYLEGMAAGLPAVACIGEPGPEEIAESGEGIVLVPPADIEALASAIGDLAADEGFRWAQGAAARATVEAAFTWERCGQQTVAAYEDALR